MNPIERVMTKRSTHFEVVLAVAVLVLVLWTTGSSGQSLWVTPLVVLVLWVAVQSAIRRYQQRRA